MLNIISLTNPITLQRNSILFDEKTPCNCLYIIVEGEVEISKNILNIVTGNVKNMKNKTDSSVLPLSIRSAGEILGIEEL